MNSENLQTAERNKTLKCEVSGSESEKKQSIKNLSVYFGPFLSTTVPSVRLPSSNLMSADCIKTTLEKRSCRLGHSPRPGGRLCVLADGLLASLPQLVLQRVHAGHQLLQALVWVRVTGGSQRTSVR